MISRRAVVFSEGVVVSSHSDHPFVLVGKGFPDVRHVARSASPMKIWVGVKVAGENGSNAQ